MKITIADTYYSPAIEAIYREHSGLGSLPYREQRDRILWESFGTADFVSAALARLGWQAKDIIANCMPLQRVYEKGLAEAGSKIIAAKQIEDFQPDVLFMQDLSFFSAEQLRILKQDTKMVLAAQCSCPWPGNEQAQAFDVIFTSFPHYLSQIEALGVRAEYLPLAFEPRVLQRINPPIRRDIDVSFVGGWGRHWEKGPKDFEILAREVSTFQWWGYGADTLPTDSALRKAYQGEAWGLDMYSIYARSKIVVNRHGEVARSCGNNLRNFEATGVGALLMTDCVDEKLFTPEKEVIRYSDSSNFVERVKQMLIHENRRLEIAQAGHDRTIREHTYAHRAVTMDRVLRELCKK